MAVQVMGWRKGGSLRSPGEASIHENTSDPKPCPSVFSTFWAATGIASDLRLAPSRHGGDLVHNVNGKIHGDGIVTGSVKAGKITIGNGKKDRKAPEGSAGQVSESCRTSGAFISYAEEHEPLAKFLKFFIESHFQELGHLFISSAPSSISAGSDWLNRIEEALGTARCLFVLVSDLSLSRRWVNFEIGAAWSRKIDIFFLCYGTLTPETLPAPYDRRQALSLSNSDPEAALRSLIEHLEQALDCRAEPKFELDLFAEMLKTTLAKVS